jgi:hypothetical protein
MLYVVITACVASGSGICEDHYIPLYADISPMACMLGAQAEIARWKEVRTDLSISRWQCKTDKMLEAAAAP